MLGDFLFRMNTLLLFMLCLVLLYLAAEIGYRLGVRHQADTTDKSQSQVNTITGAVLGLLALLLAFTFSMAAARFDMRKQLMVQEVNSIGTTYLRAQALPEPYRGEIGEMLRGYVDNRLEFLNSGIDTQKQEIANAAAEELHQQLWSRATAVIQADDRSLPASLFLQTLNETIDLHTSQLAAYENRVPESILYLLFFAALGAVALIGYGFGLSSRRNHLHMIIIVVLIALVILTIIDLDRPRRGLITVSQQRMVELQRSLNR